MPSYKGMIPGVFTAANVVCGFLALLSVIEGELITACWFVVLAAFLDGLDGKVARLSGIASQFGVELDSLADFLSFGVTPAVLIHAGEMDSIGRWGWVVAIVYIMAAAYRLARYNLMVDTEEKQNFVGLPVPAAALALTGYVIFSDYLWGGLRHDQILVGIVVVCAFLMVSQVEYDVPPDRLDGPYRWHKAGLLAVASVALLIYPRLLLFPYTVLYILSGLVREAWHMFTPGAGRTTGAPPPNGSAGQRTEYGG